MVSYGGIDDDDDGHFWLCSAVRRTCCVVLTSDLESEEQEGGPAASTPVSPQRAVTYEGEELGGEERLRHIQFSTVYLGF